MNDASPEPGWEELRRHAVAVAAQAYAPYSRLAVGAAARTVDGEIVTGCNVENVSFGLTLCAECGVVSELRRRGLHPLALAVRDRDGHVLTPCGRCRQILLEVAGPALLVDTGSGWVTIADLLPGAFGPVDLPGDDADHGAS